jgi:uncharacterized protein
MQIQIRLYAELNDFLPTDKRQSTFLRDIREPTSVKDLLEGAGVPHPEIALVLVDGEPQTFDSLIDRDCRVSAYPHFHGFELTGLPVSQPELPEEPRFVLDVHLGKLARYLRLLGFDASYNNAADDDALVERASRDERILLTRDRGLLMRRAVTLGYFVRKDDPRKQVAEVVRRFDLANCLEPFTRCMNCNGRLASVDKASIEHQLEPGTCRHFDHFWRCRDCRQIYWQGSHCKQLERMIIAVRSGSSIEQ